uniref:Uncharacterized protein n=1 Tax=viral metagenome TaxID=1070528 RepID=A0A6C0EXN0_9ZZZZ
MLIVSWPSRQEAIKVKMRMFFTGKLIIEIIQILII